MRWIPLCANKHNEPVTTEGSIFKYFGVVHGVPYSEAELVWCFTLVINTGFHFGVNLVTVELSQLELVYVVSFDSSK